ncbi:MAG: phage major capsid protein, partial [Bacteroidales bacterium]|nr:phage major capsid protein [Bacteroidales bacterium]
MHEKRLREIAAELATIETRANAIHTAVETAEQADLEQLNSEVSELETRQAALLAEKAKLEAEVDEARAFDESKAIELTDKGDKKMNLEEIRRSQAYINAYAEYFKTMLREGKADDTELRALLSDQITVSGTAGVPTPIYVEERINTAWDNDEIMGRVLRSEVPGILKVGFELSATAAVVHTEGAAAPSEEVLNLGVVTLVPGTIKKWLTLSDEIMDTHGQAFLDYIFDEIEHKIIKKAADLVVADITGSPTTATTSAAAVSNISISAASLHDFVD